jgi:hypothetical protein
MEGDALLAGGEFPVTILPPKELDMIVVRLMGALLTPKQPRFYTGRHRARLRQRPPIEDRRAAA